MEHKPTQSKEAIDAAIAKGYESNELKLRGIFVFVGVLAMTLLVVLSAIYAIMMALVEHGRGQDAAGSPVVIKREPIYAPLQPSLGYNGDHDNDHDWLDQDDMLMMRQKAQQALTSEGTSPTGRKYITIAAAIDRVAEQKMLPVKPVVKPVDQPENPQGSFEGYTPNIGTAPTTGPSIDTETEHARGNGDDNLTAAKIALKNQ